jgi:hypothetical protein
MGELTAAQATADWEAALDRVGETVEIGRQTGTDPNNVLRVQCRARVKGNRPQILAGDVQQGEVLVLAFYPDIVANGFPVPVRASDHVVIRGKRQKINSIDNNTGRIGTTQIFVKIGAMG